MSRRPRRYGARWSRRSLPGHRAQPCRPFDSPAASPGAAQGHLAALRRTIPAASSEGRRGAIGGRSTGPPSGDFASMPAGEGKPIADFALESSINDRAKGLRGCWCKKIGRPKYSGPADFRACCPPHACSGQVMIGRHSTVSAAARLSPVSVILGVAPKSVQPKN
jgi:hypothetical protein